MSEGLSRREGERLTEKWKRGGAGERFISTAEPMSSQPLHGSEIDSQEVDSEERTKKQKGEEGNELSPGGGLWIWIP